MTGILILFYGILILLTGFACLFFVPWIGTGRLSFSLSIMLFIGSYSLYKLWGGDLDFNHYYAASTITERQQYTALRARLVHLSKAEYALRVRLERVPNAPRLSWQLEELLAQRAMLAGAWRQAYQHWQSALLILAKDPLVDGLHKERQQSMTQIIAILKPLCRAMPAKAAIQQPSHSDLRSQITLDGRPI